MYMFINAQGLFQKPSVFKGQKSQRSFVQTDVKLPKSLFGKSHAARSFLMVPRLTFDINWLPSVGFCSHFDSVPRIKKCQLSKDFAFLLYYLRSRSFHPHTHHNTKRHRTPCKPRIKANKIPFGYQKYDLKIENAIPGTTHN